MNLNINRLIISLYFPMYKESKKSRFESFFEKLSKKKKNQKKNINFYKSSLIYPDRIIQGLDKRSSIELRNVPKTWSKDFLRKIIEPFGNINFLYIFSNGFNSESTSTVYVNFINYKSIVDIFMFFNKKRKKKGELYFDSIDSLDFDLLNFDVEVFYSKIQGKDNLMKLYHKKI